MDVGIDCFWEPDLKARVFWRKFRRTIEAVFMPGMRYEPPSELDVLLANVNELGERVERLSAAAEARAPSRTATGGGSTEEGGTKEEPEDMATPVEAKQPAPEPPASRGHRRLEVWMLIDMQRVASTA